MQLRAPAAVSAAIALTLAAGLAPAEPIEFRHEGRGGGTLNGVRFEPADFVITSLADTDNRESVFGSVFFIDHDASEIEIVGLGTFHVLTGTRTFINTQLVGYSRAGPSGNDLFNGPSHPGLLGWDMLGPVGPVAGPGGLLQWNIAPQIDTSGGILIFDDARSNATFTASFPEPQCYADCDTTTGVGVLDIFDFLCFQNRYDAGAPYACDCDTTTGPGRCDIFDFLCFQNAYDAGCP